MQSRPRHKTSAAAAFAALSLCLLLAAFFFAPSASLASSLLTGGAPTYFLHLPPCSIVLPTARMPYPSRVTGDINFSGKCSPG